MQSRCAYLSDVSDEQWTLVAPAPRSTPESGARAVWDGRKRTRGTKLHAAVDTLGQVRTLHVTPADADDRGALATPADAVQEATGDSVDLICVDQGYTGSARRKRPPSTASPWRL